MRDTRDPQKLGEAVLELPGKKKLSARYDANRNLLDLVPPYTSVHEDNPVAKYGRPEDVQERWAWIQVV